MNRRVVTTESADEHILDVHKNKEKELEDKNIELENQLIAVSNQNNELTKQYNLLLSEYNDIVNQNNELKNKLIKYEHDPIILKESINSIDILYWSEEKGGYDLFATFFENNMETSLKDFCEEFIIELKEMYMVE